MQYGSHIQKLISKVMNHFTALKNFSPFHFIFYFICFFILFLSTLHLTLHCYLHLQSTSLHFPCLHFLCFITFTYSTVLHFPNPRFENVSFTWEVPIAPPGSWFQSVMDLFTKEYFPMSVLCFLALIFQ